MRSKESEEMTNLRKELESRTDLIYIVNSHPFIYETYSLNGDIVIIRVDRETGDERIFISCDINEIMKRIKL